MLLARYTWEIYARRLLDLSSVYSFWKHVSNLERSETKRYLEMLYVLRLRPLIEKVGVCGVCSVQDMIVRAGAPSRMQLMWKTGTSKMCTIGCAPGTQAFQLSSLDCPVTILWRREQSTFAITESITESMLSDSCHPATVLIRWGHLVFMAVAHQPFFAAAAAAASGPLDV